MEANSIWLKKGVVTGVGSASDVSGHVHKLVKDTNALLRVLFSFPVSTVGEHGSPESEKKTLCELVRLGIRIKIETTLNISGLHIWKTMVWLVCKHLVTV